MMFLLFQSSPNAQERRRQYEAERQKEREELERMKAEEAARS